MSWYYAESGQQKGPVADAEFDSLIQSGVIRPDTLVWREGLAGWQKLSEARPAAPGMPPLVAPPTVPGGPGGVTEEAVCARDYEHDIGGYISQSWKIFKSDPWQFIAASALVYLCIFAANAIPYLSVILGIVFTGPLMGGLILFFLRKIRGQSATVGDAFGGFGPRFGQLLLGHFIPGLLAGLCVIPVLIVIAIGAALVIPAMSRGGGKPTAAMLIPLIAVGGVLALIGICVAVYFQTCWVFTLWLVADKNMSFWPAMSLSRRVVLKHWWMTFALGLMAGLLTLAGVLACGLGLLVTGPVALGMFALAYERLFGDLQPGRD